MDSATQDIFYQRIQELFYDEEKIVTCISLARDLKITLNEAKTLLKTFDSEKLKSEEVCRTYLLSGSLKDDNSLAVYLVKDEDLEKKKSLFSRLVSEVIFSIQKNKLVDFNVIAAINKTSSDEYQGPYLGSVVSKNCVKRNIKEQLPPVKEVTTIKENKSFFQNISSNNVSQKMETQDNSKEFSQKKGKQSGSIANFFSKSSPKTNGNIKAEEKKESVKPEEMNVEKENVCNDEEMDVDVKEESIKTKSQNTQKNNLKKRKKANKDNSSNKKRKRIHEICDSDSDIFEDEKEEDIIENSDEEPIQIPVTKLEPVPKNKIKKAVDKTYMDDEGFMVTTTEYVYEDAPEDEEELKEVVKEKPKVIVEKKNSSPDSENPNTKSGKGKTKKNNKTATGKQTTLMSFFKKN